MDMSSMEGSSSSKARTVKTEILLFVLPIVAIGLIILTAVTLDCLKYVQKK